MDNRETHSVIQFLNASWTAKPMDPQTAAVWGAELKAFDYADVMRSIRALLRTSKWRPSLAEIIELIVVDEDPETASEAFVEVWKEIGRVGRAGTPKLSERAAKAVRHMGGWASICATWTNAQKNWHRKEFCKEFDDIEAIENRHSKIALAAAPSRQQKQIEGKS